jgi:hypothetical protein
MRKSEETWRGGDEEQKSVLCVESYELKDVLVHAIW